MNLYFIRPLIIFVLLFNSVQVLASIIGANSNGTYAMDLDTNEVSFLVRDFGFYGTGNQGVSLTYINQIPEPSLLSLMCIGLIGMFSITKIKLI